MVLKKGGNKVKKQKKATDLNGPRELTFKDEDQEYAFVTALLGSCRCSLKCNDGIDRIGIIRGSLTKKKVFINKEDLVLVGLRDYEPTKCDILQKYTPDEVRMLKSYGEIGTDEKVSEDEVEFEIDDI